MTAISCNIKTTWSANFGFLVISITLQKSKLFCLSQQSIFTKYLFSTSWLGLCHVRIFIYYHTVIIFISSMVRTIMGEGGQKKGGTLCGLQIYWDLNQPQADLLCMLWYCLVLAILCTVNSLLRTYCSTILTILLHIVHSSLLLLASFIRVWFAFLVRHFILLLSQEDSVTLALESYEMFCALGTNCTYMIASMQNKAHIYVGTVQGLSPRNPIYQGWG